MKVAVVVPVRNGAEVLGECLAAVRGQSRAADELIVVDNGSSDGTGAVAAAAGARVVECPVRGVYRARNVGWRATDADIVAFTDADCRPAPNWLDGLIRALAEPGVAGAGGEAVLPEVVTAGQRWVVARGFLSQQTHFQHRFRPFLATANAAFHRPVLEAVGGFEESFYSGGDTDLSWRIQVFADGRLTLAPDAEVVHDFARSWREIAARHRRYAGGHALLTARWSRWPDYVASQGRMRDRTRPVWRLPARLIGQRLRGEDPSLAAIDAAVRVSYEVGLVEGRRRVRQLGVEPLPGPG